MRIRRRIIATATLAVALSACGTGGGLPESPSSAATDTFVAGASTSPVGIATEAAATPLAEASPPAPTAPPAIEAPAEPLAATVTVVEPDFLVETGTPVSAAAIDQVRALPGMELASPVAKQVVQATGPDGSIDADVLVVDPVDFRPLTPEVTAQAVGVWERLADGDVVVRHDVAAKLGLELGGDILLSTDIGALSVRVGAFAANGTPPVSAIMVPWSIAAELGVTEPTGFVLAVDDADVDDMEVALGSVLGGSPDVTRRRAPETMRATVATGGNSLKPFTYIENGDGTISIDPAWVSAHIRTVTLPGIATTRCHELMIPQLMAALDEIRALGLYDHFDPEQFGGCWVARHIDWDPKYPLSNHAWGTAIDFNTQDNWLGDVPQMDMRIVEVFEKWGFDWGGRWRRPDGMHFELARIVRPG